MNRQLPKARAPRVEFAKAQATLVALALATAMPLSLLAWTLPRALLLPVLCLVAVTAAAIAALFAWHRDAKRQSEQVTAWDVAGALVLIGCAAAMLSNSEQFVQVVNHGAMTN
jgi:hypothetical protein